MAFPFRNLVLLFILAGSLSVSAMEQKNKAVGHKNKGINPVFLSIEGPTGGGKSTLRRIIRALLGYETVKETFEEWRDIDGTGEYNLFAAYLADKLKYAVLLQTYAFSCQCCASKKAKRKAKEASRTTGKSITVVTDRSQLSGFFAFVPMMSKKGELNKMELATYRESSKKNMKAMGLKVHGIIYLKTSPEQCKERAEKRDNENKDTDGLSPEMAISFYKEICQAHEYWLQPENADDCAGKTEKLGFSKIPDDLHTITPRRIPLLILDGDVDFTGENNAEIRDEMILKIKTFEARVREYNRKMSQIDKENWA